MCSVLGDSVASFNCEVDLHSCEIELQLNRRKKEPNMDNGIKGVTIEVTLWMVRRWRATRSGFSVGFRVVVAVEKVLRQVKKEFTMAGGEARQEVPGRMYEIAEAEV